MSYARKGWGGSQLYIYLDSAGFLHCQGCPLGGSFQADSTADMVSHVHRHLLAGHRTEPGLIAALEADAAENDSWIEAQK
jgi:hypothetical protein